MRCFFENLTNLEILGYFEYFGKVWLNYLLNSNVNEDIGNNKQYSKNNNNGMKNSRNIM